MKTLLAVLLLAGCAFADTKFRNANVDVGPVTILNCVADGGLTCARPVSTGRGDLSCTPASETDTGCVSLGEQNMGRGIKHFAARIDVDGGIVATSRIYGTEFTATSGNYVGPTRSDGGIGYMSFPSSGLVSFPNSVGVSTASGTSLAQVGHLCGYLSAIPPLAAYDGVIDFGASRFVAPAQFLRLSAMVLLSGFGDGGFAHDGGVPSIRLQVWDQTAFTVLCEKEVPCNVSTGANGVACALDGGARVTAADDIYLRASGSNCLQLPLLNLCGEYGGQPSGP